MAKKTKKRSEKDREDFLLQISSRIKAPVKRVVHSVASALQDMNFPTDPVDLWGFSEKVQPEDLVEAFLRVNIFNAEPNFLIDLENDPRVCYKVSPWFSNLENAERIEAFNTSKAAKRARYQDRMDASPELWAKLLPVLTVPMDSLPSAKEWMAACLAQSPNAEDMVALLQLYNHIIAESEENMAADHLAPWTVPGRYFDLERDTAKIRADFGAAKSQKAKREVLNDAEAFFAPRKGYPPYIYRAMETLIYDLRQTLK